MKSNELINNVKKAREHDAKAIEALYQTTYPGMHSMILHLCANRNDVEDILQEGYVSAFSNLDQLRKETAFVGWLRKTMINAWRMHIRENVPDYDTTVFEVAEDQLDEWKYGPSLQDTVELSETNREIRELVQALPENQRVCMVLHYYDGMSIDEIADALGIPDGSVKSRLYYGRQKLRENMEQRGIHSYGAATVAAAEAAVSKTLLVRILAALEIASEGGTAAAGMSTAAKLALSLAALLTAGGVMGGVAMNLSRGQPEPLPPTSVQPTVTTVATTVATTTATTATTTTTTTTATTTTTITTPATTTTTAKKLYVSFDYEKTDGGVMLTRYTGNEPDVVIPESLDGLKVVAIGKNAFKYNRVLRSVDIPSTVRTIGSGAFRECSHLESLSLGSGVNVIGDAAFLGCALKSVRIPPNVREVESYAFAYSPSLTDVQAAEGVERISYAAFLDCPNLCSAILPSSVNVIGGDAFDGVSTGFTITAPEGTYAYEYAEVNGLL